MIRIWAPLSEGPSIVVDGTRLPMDAEERGWWRARDPLAAGTDYWVDLGDGELLPDPRSPWQPSGADGPSRHYDQSAFSWTDGDWAGAELTSSVIYELHVGTFTPEGTWRTAAQRLGHLVELGVTLVELLPCNTFSGERGWGYDGVLWWAPHSAYGEPDDLKHFVDSCHASGIGVVMDVVYNHLGPAGNHLPRFGPWFTDVYTTPWGDALNYDGAGSDVVRWHVTDNALMWLRDYHVDGLRLDAVHAIHDESVEHLVAELAREVAPLVPRRFLIAESDLNDPKVVLPRELGGWAADAQWSDDFHHTVHAAVTGERSGYYADFGSVQDVATALSDVFVYAGRYSPHRDRHHGAPVGDLPRTRFLGYAQTHDQIGNRAAGDRLSMLVGVEQCKLVAALVLTAPFVPMLFMGEEWGASTPWCYFTSHTDPGLAEAVRQGRRAEFRAAGWKPEDVPDPQQLDTFARSRLDWDEATRAPHAELLTWHRDLIALRRQLRLWDAPTRVSCDANGSSLVVRRGTLVIAANVSTTACSSPAEGELLMSSGTTVEGSRLQLNPWAVAIQRSAAP